MLKKIIFALILASATSAFAQIEQIWITQSDSDAKKATISWFSKQAGDSTLHFGTDKNNLKTTHKKNEAPRKLHHIEIDISKRDVNYFYQVQTGEQKSPIYSFKGYPSKNKELRVASIGNLGYFKPKFNPNLKYILAQEPHLIVSCGDNIPSLHLNTGKKVDHEDYTAFLKMIDRNRKLFASTIFISALGNHDKEFKSRGKKRPDSSNPVYDIDAKAFRKFFKLPQPEWHWKLNFADFDLALIGLDICHHVDFGTGWEACHDFHSNSEQFKWYQKTMDSAKEKFLVTFYNNTSVGLRRVEKGLWHKEFLKGSMCISGYGYYMEFAQTKDGVPYINNSLNAGDHYKDRSNAIWSERIGGFTMLVLKDGKLICKFYSMNDGTLLYEKEINSRVK